MGLEFDRVIRWFGQAPAVDGVSFGVDAGEIVSLFGPSGCGKSTLLRMAAGLERVDSGRIRIDGRTVADGSMSVAPDRRGVGMVFQDYALFPHLTVRENVMFGLKALPSLERGLRADDELIRLGLEALGHRYPHQLSGGQQQRAALARAFARRPSILLLDEPFASIDFVLRRQLRTVLRQMLKERGATAVFVTHDPEEALEVGDRVALMDRGRIIEVGTPETLYWSPQSVAGGTIFPGAQVLPGTAEGASVRTPFGLVDHRPPPVSTISVIVHAGGVKVHPDIDPAGVVGDMRFVGPGWKVRVQSLDKTAEIEAASDVPLSIGEPVRLLFDTAYMRVVEGCS